jgi:hypothetical protein
MTDLDAHIVDHIENAQNEESEWYEAGKQARAVYKKLFKKEL